MLQRLVEILEEKSAVVTQEQQEAGGTFQTGMSARQVAQFWFLHAINSSLTPLRHILLAKHRHPEEIVSRNVAAGRGVVHVQSGQQSSFASKVRPLRSRPRLHLPRGTHSASPRDYRSVAGNRDSAETRGALLLRRRNSGPALPGAIAVDSRNPIASG